MLKDKKMLVPYDLMLQAASAIDLMLEGYAPEDEQVEVLKNLSEYTWSKVWRFADREKYASKIKDKKS